MEYLPGADKNAPYAVGPAADGALHVCHCPALHAVHAELLLGHVQSALRPLATAAGLTDPRLAVVRTVLAPLQRGVKA